MTKQKPQTQAKKVMRNGKVAIAISRGFGAGWTTWNTSYPLSPFEPKVIRMIQKKRQREIDEEWCEKNLGLQGVYCGGAYDLEIVWLPIGESFSINEYDGSESLYTSSSLDYIA